MNPLQLKLIIRAVQIRLERGEELDDIIASYSKLNKADILFIKSAL